MIVHLFTYRNYVTDLVLGNSMGLILSFVAVTVFGHAQV